MFKFALCVLNIKAESTIFETGLQIFIYLLMVILKSSWFSTSAYLQAHLHQFRETIDSNTNVRQLTNDAVRNQLAAVLIGLEQLTLDDAPD